MKCFSSSLSFSQCFMSSLRSTSSAARENEATFGLSDFPGCQLAGEARDTAPRARFEARKRARKRKGMGSSRTRPERSLGLLVHLPDVPVLDGKHREALRTRGVEDGFGFAFREGVRLGDHDVGEVCSLLVRACC